MSEPPRRPLLGERPRAFACVVRRADRLGQLTLAFEAIGDSPVTAACENLLGRANCERPVLSDSRAKSYGLIAGSTGINKPVDQPGGRGLICVDQIPDECPFDGLVVRDPLT
jgi:hypothetical protein